MLLLLGSGLLVLVILPTPAFETRHKPPRATGLPCPIILSPRLRALDARPALLLASPLDAEDLNLTLTVGSLSWHSRVRTGQRRWPASFPDLAVGSPALLRCVGLSGADTCWVTRAAARPPRLWQRGGADAVRAWSLQGFPMQGFLAAAWMGSVEADLHLRSGLPLSWIWQREFSAATAARSGTTRRASR